MPKRSKKRSSRKLVSVCNGRTKCNKKYYGSNTKRCCRTRKQYKSLPKKQLKYVRMGCCGKK